MPRALFNTAERERLNQFPLTLAPEDIHTYYTLSATDRQIVNRQRRAANRLGFALQLSTLRYLGFIPSNLRQPPPELLHFVADQLGIDPAVIDAYQRQATHHQHLHQAMAYLGFSRMTPMDETLLSQWLVKRALEHDQPLLLFTMACDFLRHRHIMRPGITALERLISRARSQAHQQTYCHLQPLLTPTVTAMLADVLAIPSQQTQSRLAWLQRTPTAANATQISEVVDKIRYLQHVGVATWDMRQINPNRLQWLAKIGARSSRQSLLRTDHIKQTCILIAFLYQSLFSYTDDVIRMFDQRIWDLYKKAQADFDHDRKRARHMINQQLALLQFLGEVLLDETIALNHIRTTTFQHIDSTDLQRSLDLNEALIRPILDAQFDYVRRYSQSVRKIAKPFLATLSFQCWGTDDGLLTAITMVRALHQGTRHRIPPTAPTTFIPEPWHRHLWTTKGIDRHYYELATIWVLRERLRSGDVSVATSRRYAPLERYSIPADIWPTQRALVQELTGTPLKAADHLTARIAELQQVSQAVERLLQEPDQRVQVRNQQLIQRPDAATDHDAALVQLNAYISTALEPIAITDVLLAVDKATGFSRAFTPLPVQVPPERDRLVHLYACLLAQGCNLGFAYMAQAANLPYHQLRHVNTWWITEENLAQANTILVNAHHALPLSQVWGGGMLSSSDGQRFPMTKRGQTLTARYQPRYFGLHKGVTIYTWVSDQFSQYGSKAIPFTVRDATYVLHALLDNETDLRILEHTTDTSGYTELIFAVFDLLGLRFLPRIRDVKEQTLYRAKALDMTQIPQLAPCLTGVLQEDLITQCWDDMLRFIGSLKQGWVTASLMIQKLHAYPQQHLLLKALQAYGRLPKTLHILRWYSQASTRHQAITQLNKGESFHDLRAHLAFANQGRLGTKTDEQLAQQVGCLNLLSNIVMYWNTLAMQQAVDRLREQGYSIAPEQLRHIWPTKYKHIQVYGNYQFNREEIAKLAQQRSMSV